MLPGEREYAVAELPAEAREYLAKYDAVSASLKNFVNIAPMPFTAGTNRDILNAGTRTRTEELAMYSDTDYQNAKKQMRKYLIVTCAVFLLLLGGMIAGLIVRNRLLTTGWPSSRRGCFITMMMLKCMP